MFSLLPAHSTALQSSSRGFHPASCAASIKARKRGNVTSLKTANKAAPGFAACLQRLKYRRASFFSQRYADSGPARSPFRADGDHRSEAMPITIPS